jgi:hypothetical protein
MAILDAVLEVDLLALEGILHRSALYALKRRDVLTLWRLCWWSWERTPSCERGILNEFMAVLRSLCPWLPLPDWVVNIDPQSV